MSVRAVALAELAGVLPDLVGGASVVALVPLAGTEASAPAAAWAIARTAAALGRRTLLVDCFVDEPRLHGVVGAPSDDGIVDAFEYGASLNRIAQRQPEENLFFIPSGTWASDPGALMANRRWRRLSAGFRHEGALLLLFLPAGALPVIAGDTDGALLLAAEGVDEGNADVAAVSAAGVACVVVTTRPPGAAPAGAGPAPAAARPAVRRTRPPFAELEAVRAGGPKKTRRAVVYGALGVLAAVLATVAVRPEWVLPTPDESESAAGASPTGHRVDSLPWVVQVSAWDDLRRAQDAVDTLATRGTRALVSPTSLRRRLSYRVHAGPYPTQAAADSVLDSLRARNLADPIGSASVMLPLSLTLGGGALSAERARVEADSLRAHGVPTFLLGLADGRFRLLAGAYDDPAGAAHLDSLLFTLGRARRLGPRVGSVP